MIVVDRSEAGVSPLREAIRALEAAVELLSSAGRPLDREPAVSAVTRRLGAEGMSARPLEPAALDEVRRRVEGALASPDGLSTLLARDLRDAAWLLWTRRDPMAERQAVLDAVVKQAAQHHSTRRNLMHAWITGFSPTGPRVEEGGRAIVRLLDADLDTRLDRWREAHGRFSLFDASIGPAKVAKALLDGPEDLSDVLRDSSLDETSRGVGGFARAVQGELLRLVPSALESPRGNAVLRRVTDFLAPQGLLRFDGPETRAAIARSVLAPWLDGRKGPEGVRPDVQAFLLRHLGDPRVRAGNWREAGDAPRRVMRGWLARRSIELFFDVIADHADGKFPYRRAFWRACLDRVDDARIVLGNRVHLQANAISELRGSYARLRGASGDQSVLLMRFGELVVCEWSHSGRVRAWLSSSDAAPSLESREYDRESLTARGLPFPPSAGSGSKGAADGEGLIHYGSERNHWQGSAAELLARHCTPPIRLTARDWIPRP